MMLQLVLAYLFAAGMGVTLVYMARQNRKQGWERPAPRWFGAHLQSPETARPAQRASEAGSPELMPELLLLNRELAAHGGSIKRRVESGVESEVESMETAELVSIRRS
jgi:hypothetical protein